MDTISASQPKQTANINPNLLHFLEQWDDYYYEQIAGIPLFNSDMTSKWTLEQKTHFVKVFYHCRGHLHELIWFIANNAPNKKSKDILLNNLSEELGAHGFSHEKLYGITAEAFKVNINDEYIEQKFYLPFVKEFNNGHLRWFKKQAWEGRISAFSAYERLDNIDYIRLADLAKSIGLQGKQLTFFNVHIRVEHFNDIAKKTLNAIWHKNRENVKEAFYFIADHQLKMWTNLSHEIFSYITTG